MSIPKETIDIIRERVRIEEIIARYVPSLKKRGQNFVGLCPFHKEKTPSFTVSPKKQIFHCFGCHSGGNVFSFISKIERLNFPQSVKFVGKIVGIEITENNKENQQKNNYFNDLKRINKYVKNLYNASLKSDQGKVAVEYLSARGINEDSINEFEIGYAPETWSFVTDHLKKNNVKLEYAEHLGLLSGKDKSHGRHYYDRFRDRIIFPIINQYDDVAGFGGRIIKNGEPKYLNSPDSHIFKKRNILYGFNKAKSEITELNRAIIVEGYLDVIGCYQVGIKNVVAPLGTALTEEQVKLLSRYAEEIIILFDADSAGIKASLRSIEIAKEVNVKMKVAVLPEDDPFDFIQKKGDREFMAIVDSALDPIEFKMQQAVAVQDDSIKKIFSVFDIIKQIEYESEQLKYLKSASSLLNFDFAVLNADFKKYNNKNNKTFESNTSVKNDVAVNYTEKQDFIYRSHRDLILLLCYYPELIDKAVVDFPEIDIKDIVLRNIYKKVVSEYSENNSFSIDSLFLFFIEGKEKEFLEKNIDLDYTIVNPNHAYTEIYLSLKLYEIDQKIEFFRVQLKNNIENDDIDYLMEIEVCKREKEKLSSYMYNLHENHKNEKKISSF